MRWFIVVAGILKFLGLYRPILDRTDTKIYLERHYLFSTRWLGWIHPKLSYRVCLHRTHLSDGDGLHDHPWKWWSKILSGGYWEDTPQGRFWRDPATGWRKGSAFDYHRLILDHEKANGQPVWSLFIMGPHEKEWGFQDKNGNWVQWQEYLANRQAYV